MTAEEILEGLTSEQREHLASLETPEEALQFLSDEGAELPDELLEDIAGGGAVGEAWGRVQPLLERVLSEAKRRLPIGIRTLVK